ncbi:MAG: TetR/AcrR family transcriptional regulator [Parvibaculaceae bacterium]|nr:TetR/AcrR family transcriptional regulator [Parvibaculaceae bacterium]
MVSRVAENRRKILNAARELVLEGGFAAAQMSAVAARAGVATGSLYRYFKSKDELCRQVFREVSSREMNLLANIAEKPGSATQRLIEVADNFAGRAVRGRRLAFALLNEPVDVALAEERRRFRRTHASIFQGLIEEGIANGEFDNVDAEITAACIAGAIPTALVGPLAPDSDVLDARGDEVVKSLVNFVLKSVGAKHPLDQVTSQPKPQQTATQQA